jgi:uncharacterized protein (TIGR03437 family)
VFLCGGSNCTAAPQDYPCCQAYSFDEPAGVLYAGAAPGCVAGVVQINFRVPADLNISEPWQISVRLVAANTSSAVDRWIYVAPLR